MPSQPLSVFISYSHKDEALKQELEDHLAPLKRQNKIRPWQDRQIEAGAEWSQEILAALDTADIILLLISSRFMSSDFCYSKEMERAMQRHHNGDARVIPIILTPTDWKGAPFDKLKVLPKDGKPVVEWPNHDAAFLDVAREIRRAVDSLAPASSTQADGWATPPPPRSASGIVPPVNAPQANRPATQGQDRMQLFTGLSSLPGPQFSQLVFTLNPPPGNVPPDSSPQASRVAALLQWAESPIGPGLATVHSLLTEMIGGPGSV